MKKEFLVFLSVLLVISLCGCITIVVGPSADPSSSSAEESAEKTETESTEGTGAPDMFDPSDFYGVWYSTLESDPRFIFRPGDSCRYMELGADTDERILGFEGQGSYFNEIQKEGGTVGFTLSFASFPELDGARITLEEDELVMKKGEKEIRFLRSEKTEETVQFIAEERVDVRNGVLRELELDGKYHSSQVMSKEDGIERKTAWFTQAKVENGFIAIMGCVGKYDVNWNETIYGSGVVKLLLSEDCKIYASGGEAEDQEITAESFNEGMYDSFTGLGLGLEVKNGVVTAIYRQS